MKNIIFVANNNIGCAMSGGDRIFGELIRGWQRHSEITLIGCEEALDIIASAGIAPAKIILTDTKNQRTDRETLHGVLSHIMRRIKKGWRAIGDNMNIIMSADAIYSVSDFYPDVLPAFYAKCRNPKMLWIAGYYLFAPAPFDANSPYQGKNRIRGVMYWLMQRFSYFIVNKYADYIFVTSEPDVSRFITKSRDKSRVVVVRGGVDITASEEYLSSGNVIPVEHRKYDACFVGRLHYQKGVLELINIWQMVAEKKNNAKLAVIGAGPLEADVRSKIAEYGLTENIDMLGFVDGSAKYEIFRQSRMILHPATYDSGGMAAAEGMAWRLPAVCFDLEALKTYYPRGAMKASLGNLPEFAGIIHKFLEDKELYEQYAGAAHDLIVHEWNWVKRSDFLYSAVFGQQ